MTTRTSREEHQRSNAFWVGALLSAYNTPRYAGDVAATVAEREGAWQRLAAHLEDHPHAHTVAHHGGTTASGGGGGGGGSGREVSAGRGAARLRRLFAELLPETAPTATVTLRPAASLPWGLIGTALGLAAAGAGAFVLLKSRRPWK